jgi:hypothetical protein
LQGIAPIVECFGVARLPGDCLLEALDRYIEAIEVVQDKAAIAMCRSDVGITLDCAADLPFGGFELASLAKITPSKCVESKCRGSAVKIER